MLIYSADNSTLPISNLYSEVSYQLKICEFSLYNMAFTILTLVFAVTCLSRSMADEMKSLKDEIAVIKHLLKDQNERMTKLEMENNILKTALSKVENESLLLKDRLVDISNENKVLQHEVTDLRRQVTTILEDSNLANLDKQEEPSDAFRDTAVHRKRTHQISLNDIKNLNHFINYTTLIITFENAFCFL